MEGLFIRITGLRRIPWMRVKPNAAELFGAPAEIDLILEVIRDSFIIKGYACRGDILLDRYNVFHKKRVIGGCDAEPANFCFVAITKAQQFGPGGWGKAEYRLFVCAIFMPHRPDRWRRLAWFRLLLHCQYPFVPLDRGRGVRRYMMYRWIGRTRGIPEDSRDSEILHRPHSDRYNRDR